METVGVEARLEIDGDELVYCADGGAEVWRLRLVKILLVAEYTTLAGGLDEDYFLEFGTLDHGEPVFTSCVVPAGADGCLAELAQKLGGKMRLKLYDYVGFKSRVIWPAELEGQPVFVVLDDDAGAKTRWVMIGKKPRWHVSPGLVEWMKGR
jgi:hypothetical protein